MYPALTLEPVLKLLMLHVYENRRVVVALKESGALNRA